MADSHIDEVVERVLAQPRFQAPSEGLWDRLLDRLARWLASSLATLVESVGGPVVAGVLALGLLAALVAIAASRVARRRAARIEERLTLGRLLEQGVDPAEMERAARRAEEAGDYTLALRARFVAGLLRLAGRGVIVYTRGTTTGEIAAQLAHPQFDRLARDFEEVAYGGRPATRDDLDRALQGWRALLEAREPVA